MRAANSSYHCERSRWAFHITVQAEQQTSLGSIKDYVAGRLGGCWSVFRLYSPCSSLSWVLEWRPHSSCQLLACPQLHNQRSTHSRYHRSWLLWINNDLQGTKLESFEALVDMILRLSRLSSIGLPPSNDLHVPGPV